MGTTPRARPRGRPPRPELSRDLVLRTAIEVADGEGIDAVTLRRLADALGVHPTSIYNHVPSKDAILDGLIECLLAEANLPDDVPDWAGWIRGFAAALRRTAQSHPGAFGVFLRRTGTGPTAVRHYEAALDSFRRAGCSTEDAARAVHGVALTVLGLALEEGPVAVPMTADLDALDPAAYPRILEVESSGYDERATGPTWDLIVDTLIAGFATRLHLTVG